MQAQHQQRAPSSSARQRTRGRPLVGQRPSAEVRAFETEADLHRAVSAFLTRLGIPHRNQHPVADGRADIALELPTGAPWALLELKNDLEDLQLSAAADYFEQALKYRLASALPVFIGPFFSRHMGVVAALSGAPAALCTLGGRADVGLLFIHHVTGLAHRPETWFGFQMLLRTTRVAAHDASEPGRTIWPAAPLALVDLSSAGSRRDRA